MDFEEKDSILKFDYGREMEEARKEYEYEDDDKSSSMHFQNNSNFDPDVNLSHIDDRVHSLLGHFLKDFEAGGLKEILGAKYGAYGSFLHIAPSDSCHARTSQNVQYNNIQRSPSHISMKKSQQDTTYDARTRLGKNNMSTSLMSASIAPSSSDSYTGEACLPSFQGTKSSTPKRVAIDSSVSPTKHKPLKCEMETGSICMEPEMRKDIYKKLGLDSSPSSSEDDPAQSRGLYPYTHEAPEESPSSILEIMTSFLVSGECLLSPLSNSFLSLAENQGERNWKSMASGDTSKLEKQNSKDSLAHRASGDRSESPHGDVQLDWRTDRRMKADKRYDSSSADFDGSIGMEALIGESPVDPSKEKFCQRATAQKQGGSLKPQRKEQTFLGGKEKLKHNQHNNIAASESHKESNGVDFPSSMRDKNATGIRLSSSKLDVDRLCTKSGNTKAGHGDSFSELKKAEKRSVLQDSPSRDGPKCSKFRDAEKKIQTIIKKPKEKFSGELFDNSLASEPYPMAPPVTAPSTAKKGIVSDIVPAKVDPVLIKENWVCCDRCEKWRLLPFGTDADHLKTDYWQCSMLNWLPGMNQCGFSEEETTKALYALYQLPPPDCNQDAAAQSHQDHNLPNLPKVGKKKEHDSGDAKHSKSNAKRLAYQDGSRVFKKKMPESLYSSKEDYSVENGGFTGKRGSVLSNDFPIRKDGKICPTYCSSEDSKSNQDRRVAATSKKLSTRNKVSFNGEGMDTENNNNSKGVNKKRKLDWLEDSVNLPEARPRNAHNFWDKEESDESGIYKEKKVRVDKYEPKESSTRKGHVNTLSKPTTGSLKEIKPSILPSGDEPKVQNLLRKHDYQNSTHRGSTRYCTQTEHVARDIDARSSAEEDSSSRPAAKESTLVKKARLVVKLSIKGGNMDTGSSDNGLSLNRKMEWEDNFQDNTEETSESGSNKQEKVRVPNYEPKQSSTRKGNWNTVSQPTAGIQTRSPMLQADVSGDEPKVQKQQKKPVNQNESHHCSSRSFSQNDHASRDIDLRSSAEKNLPSQSSANESSVVKKPRVRASFNGESMEIGNFVKVNTVVAMNRETDCQESKNYLPVARQSNRRSSFQDNKEEANESRIIKDKEVRVPKYEGEESIRRRGDGNTVTQPTAGIYIESTPKILPVDVSGDEQRVQIQPRIPDIHRSTGHCTKSRYVSTDIHTQSSVEIDSPGLSAAKEVINEGYDLKHKADRLKVFESELESTNLSFQAALKFLRGGFLLESCSLEIAKRRDIADSIFIYKETAKLCQFVADEYEKRNEMAAAALAYKCMEVAYMRIISSRDMRISQDRHELQMAYPDTHQGESPSSSVSDVDSLHNHGMLANVSPSKRRDSKSEEDHIIVEEDVPKYERVLDHLEFVDIAMETNRKCQETLAAAIGSGESNYAEGLPYVQNAVSCSFSDVIAVIRLIQLALDALMIDN